MPNDAIRVIRTRHGASVLEGRFLLSKVLSHPGPTHEVFDVLATCVAQLATGGRVAILGFGAGGIVSPLRAMGCDDAVVAVDRERHGARVFRELSSDWCGDVEVAHGGAVQWLRRRRARFDVIVDDLSVLGPDGATKPADSWQVLPRLMRSRLAAAGVVVVNALPVLGLSWKELLDRLVRPFRSAQIVYLTGLENRIVVAGDRLPPARQVGRSLRRGLSSIGSRQLAHMTLRTLS